MVYKKVKDLDHLPDGSVVLDGDGDAWQKWDEWFFAAAPELLVIKDYMGPFRLMKAVDDE